MSPAPVTPDVATSASPKDSPAPPTAPENSSSSPTSKNFDDIFHTKFMQIINNFRNNPNAGPLTQKERKSFIETAYLDTDSTYFGGRPLTDHEIKMRALTKVFYKVLAEEPWSDDWIRPHDVERKLSRFEMHKDSMELAAQHNIFNPREAIAAARLAQISFDKADLKGRVDRGPFDDIEIIYIPGTVSSHATNAINRDTIYPISSASVAHTLHKHICRDMVRPYAMAETFVTCADTEKLLDLKEFASNVCDFAPHLLDNDNVSLLIVLLILARSEICRRFENNGIRIEGSTISHRRAECMKQKLGWKTAEDRKPFDNVASEFQTRLKNACNPAPRAQRAPTRKQSRKSSIPATPATPPVGYYASPQVRTSTVNNANSGINIQAPSVPPPFRYPGPLHPEPLKPAPAGVKGTNGVKSSSAAKLPLVVKKHAAAKASDSEPMDLS